MTTIDRIRESDTQAWIDFCRVLDTETKFMLYEPGERDLDFESNRKRLEGIVKDADHALFVARDGERIVGFASVAARPEKRIRHRGYIVTGLLKSYWGKGIARRLFGAIDEWALARGMTRLELTTMIHNERAVALYRRLGFVAEGVRKDSIRVDGKPVDEYAMAKYLG